MLSLSRRLFLSPARTASMATLRVVETITNDPFFNLAYEECLMNEHVSAHTQDRSISLGLSSSPCDKDTKTLFLWQNGPCVILGRHQNPYKELFLNRVESDKIDLVRRKSGGGTVFQDHGNSIFSFLGVEKSLSGGLSGKEFNNQILLNALKSFNIDAECTGRNDILLSSDGRKISGHAFQREKGLLLHHGTMLINVDFGKLQNYLNPNKLKLQAKGVSSVSARVANLKTIKPDLDHRSWSNALIRSFLKAHSGTEEIDQIPKSIYSGVVETVDHNTLANSPRLKAVYDGLREWAWRYGATPAFSHELEKKFEWGLVNVHLQVSEGLFITDAKIFSDALNTALIEKLEAALKTGKVKYEKISLASACQQAAEALEGQNHQGMQKEETRQSIQQFQEWIQQEL